MAASIVKLSLSRQAHRHTRRWLRNCPSLAFKKGPYRIIAGTLDDLASLPLIPSVLDDLRTERTIYQGTRNNSVFRFALEQVRHCDTLAALLDVLRTRNLDCEPQLADDVLIAIASSAWRYEDEGRNLIGRGRSVVTPHSVIDQLISENQDAFVLLTLLQRHHWGRSFVLANAMSDRLGWSRKRFAVTRRFLHALGFIKLVAPARFGPQRFIVSVHGMVDIDHQ